MKPKASVSQSQPASGEVWREELRIVDLDGKKLLRNVGVRSNGDVMHISDHSRITVKGMGAPDKPELYEQAITDARRQIERAFDKDEIPCEV